MRKKVFLLGLFSLLYIICFPVIKEKLIDAKYTITITPAEAKNEASLGTEIWIDCIKKDDVILDNNSFTLYGEWENNGRLYNAGDNQDPISIIVKSKKITEINFIMHPYSGIVEITDYKGNTDLLDLYSPEEKIYTYILKY